MTRRPAFAQLTPRQRQVLEVIYRLGRATAVDVMTALPDEPNNATIRSMLNYLEEKGFLRHDVVKGRFHYSPTVPVATARESALASVIDTFFRGSEPLAVAAILRRREARLTEHDRRMLLDLIEQARQQGR